MSQFTRTGNTDPTALRSEPLSPALAPDRDRQAARLQRQRRREALRDVLVPAVPTALAACLCSYAITSRSLGFDEAASVTIAAQHGASLGHALAHDGGNMSGYYVLLHALIGLWGNGLLVVRLPSVLCAAATAGLVTLLAQTLFGRRVALISGVLTAVSLPLVFWGQSARGYAPMMALTAASYLAFTILVRREAEGRPTGVSWVAYALTTMLAVYASFVAVLIVPAQLLMLARRPRALRLALGAVAFAALCWVPLVVLALSRGSGQLFWVPRPSLASEKQVLEALSSSGLQPNFHPTATTVILLCLTAAIVAAVAVALLAGAARGTSGGAAWSHGLVLSWLAVPVVLAWLESLLGQSIFLPRNLLLAVPAVAVLLALGIAHRRVPRLAAGAVLLALIVLRGMQVTASYGVSPENWRAATAYVLTRTASSDCVAFYPSDGRMAFRYYLAATTRAPLPILPSAPWGKVSPYVEDYASLSASVLRGLPSRCPRLWLISSHEGDPRGPAASRADHARYLRLRAELAGEYPRRLTARFGYASTVRVELFARS